MLKKSAFLFSALICLSACPAPNASETPDSNESPASSGEANFSKEAYIRLMTCLKTQQPGAAASIDQAIAAAESLPDSAFENADSPIFAVWAAQAEAAGCGA